MASHPLVQFHLAFPVTDLAEARAFYGDRLGCTIGRSSDQWIDFNFYGHQITAHLQPAQDAVGTNGVDGEAVPVRHFGVILDWQDWHDLAAQLEAKGMTFVIKPYIRFKGEIGEQATLFIQDPSGNALEFKSFKRGDRVFATQ